MLLLAKKLLGLECCWKRMSQFALKYGLCWVNHPLLQPTHPRVYVHKKLYLMTLKKVGNQSDGLQKEGWISEEWDYVHDQKEIYKTLNRIKKVKGGKLIFC